METFFTFIDSGYQVCLAVSSAAGVSRGGQHVDLLFAPKHAKLYEGLNFSSWRRRPVI